MLCKLGQQQQKQGRKQKQNKKDRRDSRMSFCLFQELYRKKNEGKRRQRQLHKYEQNLLRPKLVASDAFKAVNGYVETNISIIVRGDEQAPIGSGPRNCHKGNAHRAWKNPTAAGNRL